MNFFDLFYYGKKLNIYRIIEKYDSAVGYIIPHFSILCFWPAIPPTQLPNTTTTLFWSKSWGQHFIHDWFQIMIYILSRIFHQCLPWAIFYDEQHLKWITVTQLKGTAFILKCWLQSEQWKLKKLVCWLKVNIYLMNMGHK